MKSLRHLFMQIFVGMVLVLPPLSLAQGRELPKDSIYNLKSEWKNQNSENFSFQSLQGQAVIMTMTYTGCEHSCPMTIAKLEEIEKDLKKKGIKNYQVVIASFDPVKDTPERLKTYMAKKKMDESRWIFLSAAKDEEVRKLSVLLGISYQKIEDGDFSHSNEISLLDFQGRIGIRMKGLASSHDELVQMVSDYEKKN